MVLSITTTSRHFSIPPTLNSPQRCWSAVGTFMWMYKQADRSVYVTSRVWQAATPMSLPLVVEVSVITALRDELEVLLDLAPGGQTDGRRTKHLWLSLPPPSVSASWHARCFPLIHRWHRRGLTAQMSVQTLSVFTAFCVANS